MHTSDYYSPKPYRNVYGPKLICHSPSGSFRWFAVRDDGKDVHPAEALWIDGGSRSVATSYGSVTTDGMLRFFRTRRDLIAALEGRIQGSNSSAD